MAYVEGQDRNQIMLLPECIDNFISDDNPVRVIDAFVEGLDLNKLEFTQAEPSVLAKVL